MMSHLITLPAITSQYSHKACSQEILSLLNFNIQLHFHKQTACNILPNLSTGRQYGLGEYKKKTIFIDNYVLDLYCDFDQTT